MILSISLSSCHLEPFRFTLSIHVPLGLCSPS